MTADEARAITDRVNAPPYHKVKAVLEVWERAIARAAARGEYAVRETGLDPVVGDPITAAERRFALSKLQERGFTVKTVQDGPNEYATEVSWRAEQAQPSAN